MVDKCNAREKSYTDPSDAAVLASLIVAVCQTSIHLSSDEVPFSGMVDSRRSGPSCDCCCCGLLMRGKQRNKRRTTDIHISVTFVVDTPHHSIDSNTTVSTDVIILGRSSEYDDVGRM